MGTMNCAPTNPLNKSSLIKYFSSANEHFDGNLKNSLLYENHHFIEHAPRS
jgi:hypothetical protein